MGNSIAAALIGSITSTNNGVDAAPKPEKPPLAKPTSVIASIATA